MKYAAVCFLSILAVLAVLGPADAHRYGPNGEGNPWYMPAVPNQVVANYDGNLDDWSWFPSRWTFTGESFASFGNWNEGEAAVPKDDWDFVLYGPAWIPATNQVTWAVKVTDNIMYAPHADLGSAWQMDGGQFGTDADHGGEDKGNDQEYQQNYFTIAQGGHIGLFGDQSLAWEFEQPYAAYGFTIQPNGSYEVEIAVTLWDHLDPGGPSASTLHTLAAGQTIGFTVELYDMDSDSEQEFPDAEFDFGNVAIGGSVIADYYLLPESETLAALAEEGRPLPSAVEPSSWGRIKSSFVN